MPMILLLQIPYHLLFSAGSSQQLHLREYFYVSSLV